MEYTFTLPSPSLYEKKKPVTTPRLIIHGGAGNILPSNFPPSKYKQYHHALLTIVSQTYAYLLSGHDALDTVSFAVTKLENCELFNSGHGAVFTREGVNELEASVMVSSGKKKRGVGVMGLKHVKNPIKLAREMLLRGERDLEGGNGEHRGPMSMNTSNLDDSIKSSPAHGAQGHSQLYGTGIEDLAKEWGLELVPQSYYFVQMRWDEHIAGLEREKRGNSTDRNSNGKEAKNGMATWDKDEYVSQGTCGAVALDAYGVAAVATSTGGMTNKLSGRIGDTPTLGAGFWAESWEEDVRSHTSASSTAMLGRPIFELAGALKGIVADCLPSFGRDIYSPLWNGTWEGEEWPLSSKGDKIMRATAISGTGNGDSFLRMNAVRTASAIARYRPSTSLAQGMEEISGPGGELEKSAGNRWKKTGEGEGGMVGIEGKVLYGKDGEIKATSGEIVVAHNCGGMFRAVITKDEKAVCRVWKKGEYDFEKEGYEGEGKEYDYKKWLGKDGES